MPTVQEPVDTEQFPASDVGVVTLVPLPSRHFDVKGTNGSFFELPHPVMLRPAR